MEPSPTHPPFSAHHLSLLGTSIGALLTHHHHGPHWRRWGLPVRDFEGQKTKIQVKCIFHMGCATRSFCKQAGYPLYTTPSRSPLRSHARNMPTKVSSPGARALSSSERHCRDMSGLRAAYFGLERHGRFRFLDQPGPWAPLNRHDILLR